MIDRVILLVLDSVGIGALPDAPSFGDSHANTLVHTAQAVGGVKLPHLQELGLGNIISFPEVEPLQAPAASFGRMATLSPTKDTTGGHWEISGVVLDQPFPVYPRGFPPEVINPFEEAVGRRVLGNMAASGTEIIQQLGKEHLASARPIVYTSADSVFQIAAHEEVVPLEELYRWCRVARKILTGKHAVGRVIARPFTGEPGNFQRTANRKDFSLEPPGETILDIISGAGLDVVAVGKIEDIFAGRGVTRSIHTTGNAQGFAVTVEQVQKEGKGLIFTNLVDFDMIYGHRNNPRGYADALEAVDRSLPDLKSALKPGDVLAVTADHGCDPTTGSTDHSREYVPLLVYSQALKEGVDLGTRSSLADLGATVCELLGLRLPAHGTSFAKHLL